MCQFCFPAFRELRRIAPKPASVRKAATPATCPTSVPVRGRVGITTAAGGVAGGVLGGGGMTGGGEFGGGGMTGGGEFGGG